jgi:hypothetical protein
MTAPDDILDTRLAFKPGSGYFGWLLCPGAEIVPDEFDDDWATKKVRMTALGYEECEGDDE